MEKRVIFLGAPGSGKGTWAVFASRALGLAHLSTGDLLRRELSQKTALGLEAERYMTAGNLVPDELILKLVDREFDSIGGFILDGFPRTLNQAEALDDMLARRKLALDRVIYLAVPVEILVERITNRRVCLDCGAPYNLLSKKPKQEGVCDDCGGRVIQRADDNETALQQRLAAYEQATAPLLDYYRAQNKLVRYENVGAQTKAREAEFLDLLLGGA